MFLFDRFKMMGIRERLVMLMLATGFSLLVAVLAVMVPFIRWNLTNLIGTQQQTLLGSIQTEIDLKITSEEKQLTAVAGVMPPEVMNDPVAAQQFLENRVGINAVFDDGLAVLTTRGILIAETPRQSARTIFDFSSYQFFRQAISAKRTVVSEPFRSTKPPYHPVVQFCAPVRDRAGNYVGILSGGIRIDGDHIIGSIAQHKIGKTGYLYLYSKDRTMLVHPDPRRIMQKDVPLGSNVLFDKALTGWDGSGITVNSRGVKTVSSFRHINSTPWILASSYPTAEAFLPMRHTIIVLTSCLILVGIICLILSWFVLRTITSPLAAFTEHLQHLEDKRGTERLFNCTRSREITSLASSFNRMILDIDQQHDTINKNLLELHEQAVLLEEEVAIRQQTEEELKLVSEQHRNTAHLLQNVCDNVPDLIWAKDLHHRYIFTNKANNDTLLFPKTPDEPIGKTHDYFAAPIVAAHPEDPLWYHFSDLCSMSDVTTLATLQLMRFQEYGYVQGVRICLDVYKAPFYDGEGRLIGTVGSARIVTHEKQLEAEAVKLNRIYRLLSNINQLIVHRPEPVELYREICRISVEEGGFTAAWVGTPGGNGVVQPVAASCGLSVEQLEELSAVAHTTQCETIMSQGRVLILSDVTSNPEERLCPACLQIYRIHPFASLASYPIKVNNTVALVLTLYSQAPGFFDDAEQELLQELCDDISYAVNVHRLDQSQQYLTNYDLLTGLPNRTMLLMQLEHAIVQAKREEKHIALLHIDLDRFKEINESYGHESGDDLLRQAAERLTSRLRQTDMISRPGGDEFTVVLEDADDPQDCARVAADILDILSEPFDLYSGLTITIGASIGIALFPEHGTNHHDLLQNVDSALYLAKNEGRGCFRFYSEELTIYARNRLDLEAKLRAGIRNDELRVFFQPQINIVTGAIIGAEALVRWQSPELGMISPASFIPIAENSGLIMKLGEYVLRETCRQGVQWLQEGLPRITLAVNLSPLQLRQGNIVATVRKILEETDYPAELLELEVTESALMEHGEKGLQILHDLRSLGLSLAMDDFGTGYSSLAYLKYFPLNVLKIDKSFVDDLPDGPNDRKIVSTIVQMGQHLGFKVLAEGVEREEQRAFLQTLGCDLFQGYLFSKPVPAEEFAVLLRLIVRAALLPITHCS